MSELRIGLAVEGPTDALVIEAGLNAFLEKPFISVILQPDKPAKERLVHMKSDPGKPPRLRKKTARFQKEQPRITSRWPYITENCPQAKAFQESVAGVIRHAGFT